LARCEQAGARVEPAHFGGDLEAVWRAWLVWRRALVAPRVAPLLALKGARERIKPGALWEHDQAQGTSALDLMRASEVRTAFHRWMEVTLYATFTGLPAISVPAAFHCNGRWPMGLQWIGRPRGEAALLAAAAGYERVAQELIARQPPL
jgi:amidase